MKRSKRFIKVEPINDKNTWDNIIDSSPYGTLFHRWDFLHIQEKYGAGRLMRYGIYEDGRLICIIPLFLKADKGLKFLYSPPRSTVANTQYLGFVMDSRFSDLKIYDSIVLFDLILKELDKTIRRISPNYTSIGLTPMFKDIRPFIWNGYEAELKYTYFIDLTRPLDAIWNSFDRECRKKINDSSKCGLSIEETNDADTFCNIMAEGLKVGDANFYKSQTPQYIKDLLAKFPDNIKMYFLYLGKDIQGVKVNIGYKKSYTAWMGAVHMGGGHDFNEYLIWELMKRAKSEGYVTYENVGGDEKRLNPFKSKFNPSLEPCFYVYKKDIIYKTAKYGMEIMEKLSSHSEGSL